MSFTLDIWKEKVGSNLRTLSTQVVQRALPHTLYASLCGAALWPLIEAARQGETLPVMVALGTVAAGVGGNLLAEQIQRWKDRADEGTISAWVAAEAPANETLREALDALLERVDALDRARSGLPEADRAWFDQRLREELHSLGNLDRYTACLEGDGAISQGPGDAIGSGGVKIGGSVGADVVTGTKTTTNVHHGDSYTIHIARAEGLAIGDRAQVIRSEDRRPEPATSPLPSGTAAMRQGLQKLDDVALDTLCLDHFPAVYDQFSRGLRRDEKVNQLLDHCRRDPDEAQRLNGLLK